MSIKRVRIIKYISDICWWMGCLEQECDVIKIEELYDCVRIKVKKNDPNVIGNGKYELEGYIPLDCVEVIG